MKRFTKGLMTHRGNPNKYDSHKCKHEQEKARRKKQMERQAQNERGTEKDFS